MYRLSCIEHEVLQLLYTPLLLPSLGLLSLFGPCSRGFPVFSCRGNRPSLAYLSSVLFFFLFSSSLLFSLLSFTLHSPITSILSPYLKHTISIRSILFLHISLHLLFHQSEQFSKCICVTFSSFLLSLWQPVALLAASPRRTCLSRTFPSSLLFKMTTTSGGW